MKAKSKRRPLRAGRRSVRVREKRKQRRAATRSKRSKATKPDKTRARHPPAPKDLPSPPKRKPGAPPMPELDLHAFEASRNWNLLQGDLARRTRGKPGKPADRLGQSRSVRNLLDAARGQKPKHPPLSEKAQDSAMYPYVDRANLAIPELGYGETVTDERWIRQADGTLRKYEPRISRRTRTGRRIVPEPFRKER